MPLKLNVGLARKVGDQNYGSRGASVTVEMELESALFSDPAKLQDRIRQLFGLVRTSLAEELNGVSPGHSNTTPGNGIGGAQQASPHRPATQSQLKAITSIAKRVRVDLSKLVQERFQVGRTEDLSIKQASAIIDELMQSGSGKGG